MRPVDDLEVLDDKRQSRQLNRGVLFPCLRIIVWAVALLAVFVWGLVGVSMVSHAGNAVTEASGAALTCAGLVAVYATARGVTFILSDLERVLGGR